jgi:hypothetical protein
MKYLVTIIVFVFSMNLLQGQSNKQPFILDNSKVLISFSKSIIVAHKEQVKGKGGYIYTNGKYVVLYLEQTKKAPLVYEVKFNDLGNKFVGYRLDSIKQNVNVEYAAFESKESEDYYFSQKDNWSRPSFTWPSVSFSFNIPYGQNKRKPSVSVSYAGPQIPGAASSSTIIMIEEGRESTDRYNEMEAIISKYLSKKKK